MAFRKIAAPKIPAGYVAGAPIRPNLGLEREYRRKLLELVDEMYASVTWWIGAEYRRQLPRIMEYDGKAKDASPAADLMKALRRRLRQWQRRFDEKSDMLAEWFARQAEKSASAAVAASVAGATGQTVAGVAVEFQMTRAMNNALASIIFENTSLIRSLPQKAFLEIEGLVMRGARTGYDAGRLTEELQKRFGVTRRRAEFISRDQMNKATEALSRVRMQELGIAEAVWIHSGTPKQPRPTHLKFNGQPFELDKGLYDADAHRYVQPGELPNCYCTKRPLIPAYEKRRGA